MVVIRYIILFLIILFFNKNSYTEEKVSPEDVEQMEQIRKGLSASLSALSISLIDEMVYNWTQIPPFLTSTSVALVNISMPIGIGTGLEVELENHLNDIMLKNPKTNLKLVYCSLCREVLINANKTYLSISKGAENPAYLSKIANAKYLLFLDLEAEGSSLVLRANLVNNSEEQEIAKAWVLSTSTTKGSLLQSGDTLKSPEQLKQEYLDILRNKATFHFPIRLILRQYASSNSSPVSMSVPFLWLEGGLEIEFGLRRNMTVELNGGATTIGSNYTGWAVGFRYSNLLSSSTPSLINPDFRFIFGANVLNITGTGAMVFNDLTAKGVEDIISAYLGKDNKTPKDPSATLGSFKLGLEMRAKNRYSVAFYGERLVGQNKNSAIGLYFDIFNSFGMEIGLWF